MLASSSRPSSSVRPIPTRRDPATRRRPSPPAAPTARIAAPDAEPAPVKKKRRLRDPLSILLVLIIVVSLLVAGLIGAELYVRNQANNKVAEAVACEVKGQGHREVRCGAVGVVAVRYAAFHQHLGADGR